MTLFPELEGMSLDSLLECFSSDARYKDNLAERDLWLQEVAVRIAKSGSEGVAFLVQRIPDVDQARLRAILLSFSFLPAQVAKERRRELKEILFAFLGSKDPMLIAEAIEALNALGFSEAVQNVRPFLTQRSPYVVGSALRYFSKHYPEIAKPILFESLKSKEPIVRQNAIDELDHLRCYEALPYLRSLFDDEDTHVREAAQSAVVSLEQGD